MNTHLVSYIDKKLDEAANFVIRYMPVNMPTDRIYEDLVGEPHVAAAFREAVKYLPPSALNRRAILKLGDLLLNVSLRFAPTDAYPVFLMPKYDLAVTHESELGQSMSMAIQVTREWEMLIKTWEKFREAAPDPHTLGFLFPWLREIMLDFHVGLLDVSIKRKADREKIEREVRAIQRRFPPKSFPRLSIELNRVCQSGKRLFGQYRMLEASTKDTDLTRAALSIDRVTNLSPAWLNEHMEECIAGWFEETMAITRQDGSDMTGRRRKAFKVTVPFVTPQERR
jgi:hypothetical protein